VDSFTRISAAEATTILRGWLDQLGPISLDDIDGDLDGVLGLFNDSVVSFYLSAMRDDAQHEWGWVVGHTGFYEFILIGSDEVTIVVASDD
jgi:hypothetical protein